MNRFATVFLVTSSLTIAGCGSEEPPMKPKVTAKDVQNEAREAATTATQYGQQQKNEFVKSTERTMEELKSKIAGLKKDAQSASGKIRANVKPQIETLEQKWEAAQVKLEEFKKGSADAWNEMRQGLEEAMTDLRRSYNKAVGELKTT